MTLFKQNNLLKFIFTIKTKHGVIVENLQISAPSQASAEDSLLQMYRQCSIIQVTFEEADAIDIDLEKVLDLIVNA